MSFLVSYLISSLIEFLVFQLFFKRNQLYFLEIITFILVINFFTQTLFIYVLPLLNIGFIYYLLLSEGLIILIEGLFISKYFRIQLRKGIIVSSFINLASWQLTPFVIFFIYI